MIDRRAGAPLDLGNGQVTCGRGGPIRSYDHRGVVFAWEPPAGKKFRRAAIDVEAFDSPTVRYLSDRYGLSGRAFLRCWTATEVLAKILDVPILEQLKKDGLIEPASSEWSEAQPGIWLRTIPHVSHQVTVGVSL